MSTASGPDDHWPKPLAERWEPAGSPLGAIVGECADLRRGFANWPSLLAAIAVGRLRGQPLALHMQVRGGPTLQTLSGDWSWWTVVECFGRDCYRLRSIDLPQGPAVVDIGANIGAFTLAVLARWPEARVTAIDASPTAVEVLTSNIARYGASARVVVRHAAVVGPERGAFVFLHERHGNLCMSSLLEPADVGPDRQVKVPAVELPAVLNAYPAGVDLLKLDIEGAEYEVLGTVPVEQLATIGRMVIEYHAVPGHGVNELARRCAAAGMVWEWHEHSPDPAGGCAAGPGRSSSGEPPTGVGRRN